MELVGGKLRIALAQPHEALREGLEILLELRGDIDIVCSCDNLNDALAEISLLQPDVVLLDADAAEGSIVAFLEQLRRCAPACKSVVLSAVESEDCARAALHAGVDGFLVLTADVSELTAAIQSVLSGRRFVCHSTATRILDALLAGKRTQETPAPTQSITGREREVLTRIALGNSNKAIARELGLSPKTVEKHRSNLMRKLQLHNAAAITMYAIRNGLTSHEPTNEAGAMERRPALPALDAV